MAYLISQIKMLDMGFGVSNEQFSGFEFEILNLQEPSGLSYIQYLTNSTSFRFFLTRLKFVSQNIVAID